MDGVMDVGKEGGSRIGEGHLNVFAHFHVVNPAV